MRLDVYLTPAELQPNAVAGKVVVVIDVLRASTTITAALFHGAKSVIPFAQADEVAIGAKQFDRGEALLVGERKMLPISGFDLGNSPGAFTADVVAGKTILCTTTNGTQALLATQGALETVVGSYVNCSAVNDHLASAVDAENSVVIICAGQDRHFALEDAGCAGRFVNHITKLGASVILNDAARSCALIDQHYGDDLQALFLDASHGRSLADAGFGDDLTLCGQIDIYPMVPIYADRQITQPGVGRGR